MGVAHTQACHPHLMGVLGLPGPGKVAEGQEVVKGGSSEGSWRSRGPCQEVGSTLVKSHWDAGPGTCWEGTRDKDSFV